MKYITHTPAIKDVKIWVAILLLFVLVPWWVGYGIESNDPLFMVVIALIVGFFIFHLVIRGSLSFMTYFCSRYNPLTSKWRKEMTYDVPQELMLEKLIEVIDESHFRLKAVDKERGLLLAITSISWRSWGENLYIRMEPEGEQTRMIVCSATLFQLYDWGKNKQNLQTLMTEIEESFTV